MSAGGAKRVRYEDPPMWLIAVACIGMGSLCLLGGLLYDDLYPEPKPAVELWMPLMPKTGMQMTGVIDVGELNQNWNALHDRINGMEAK